MKSKAIAAATKIPSKNRFNASTIFNINFFNTFNTFTLLIS